MSLLHSQTSWFIKGDDKTAATYTFGPFNFDVLNACQFYLKYTGAVNTTVNVLVSPCEAFGRDVGEDPFANAALYKSYEALAAGANAAQGFFDPPTVMDRPFKSAKVQIVVAGSITGVWFGLCSNAAAPG